VRLLFRREEEEMTS